MRDIFTVFGFTLRENLRKRVFWVITVLVLVVIIAACGILAACSAGKNRSLLPDRRPGAGSRRGGGAGSGLWRHTL